MRINKPLCQLAGVLFLLFSYNSYGQSEKEKYLNLIGDWDKDFDKTEIPEKWANESAVIIAEKQDYSSTKIISNDLTWRSSFRRRIKLLDKAAVDEFSFFFFSGEINKRQDYPLEHYVLFDSLQILVTKPNGTSRIVDLSKAVKVEKDVKIPAIFRTGSSSSYQKIAIPDLEPGDIIDYCTTSKFQLWIKIIGSYFAFSPFLYVVNNVYPTLKHKLNVTYPTNRKSFGTGYMSLYLNTSNGVPPLKKETIGDMIRFYVEMDNIEKDKNERWYYEYRSAPSIKGQIFYITMKEGQKVNGVLNPIPFGVKETVSEDDVLEYVYNGYSSPSQNYSAIALSDLIIKYLNKNYEKGIANEEKVKIAYYYYRTLVNLSPPGSINYGNSNEMFIKTMQLVFKKMVINYTLVAGISRKIGTPEKLLLRDELYMMIKPNVSTPMYLYTPDVAANAGDLDGNLQGIDAFQITINNDLETSTVKKITLPVSTASQNGIWEKDDYTIDEEFDIIKVANEKKAKGENRYDIYNSILISDEYEDFDIKTYYNPNYVPSKDKIKNANKKADANRRESASYEETKAERLKILKNSVEEDFEVESYDEYKLIQDGRSFDKQDLIIQQKYKIKGLLQKAGSNYVFNAGKLIGGQVEIKEDEMKRQFDIYMNTARSFVYSITVSIPEGYVFEGIEKLNFDVSNTTGTFRSKASMEGDKLKLEVEKIYNHNFEKKEDWANMVKFLDACYDFTETKVFIKKK
jgi:hypothetical protein